MLFKRENISMSIVLYCRLPSFVYGLKNISAVNISVHETNYKKPWLLAIHIILNVVMGGNWLTNSYVRVKLVAK